MNNKWTSPLFFFTQVGGSNGAAFSKSDKTLLCNKLNDVTRNMLISMSLAKENLADITLNMGSVISDSRNVLCLAVIMLDEQK